MQATTFLAPHRATDDQVGGDDQIAQFDQVMTDPEVGVELIDFPLQQADAILIALEPLGGAHKANEAPHEAAQLVPVVGNDHFLVGIGDPAFIPMG